MLKLETGLSNNVLYYWFDEEGNAEWITASAVRKEKEKLDKIFKSLRIKKVLKIAIPAFILTTATLFFIWFCFYAHSVFDKDTYFNITNIVKIPIMFAFPIAIPIMRMPLKNEEFITYRLRRFKHIFNDYFEWTGQWKKLESCKAGESGGTLGISELMSRMVMRY